MRNKNYKDTLLTKSEFSGKSSLHSTLKKFHEIKIKKVKFNNQINYTKAEGI